MHSHHRTMIYCEVFFMKNFEHKSKFIFLCTANSFYTCQATKSFCLQLEEKSSIPLHPTWSIWFLLTPASIGQRFPWKAVMVFHSKELAEIVPKKNRISSKFCLKNYLNIWQLHGSMSMIHACPYKMSEKCLHCYASHHCHNLAASIICGVIDPLYR